ncbi:MAG: pantoate--beta-alanine ligase, partial [Candidatus Omnitrophica bacterium]|nr:pantoate--beta-alanine ligase [Candidatus Omnitrophota bacterium]
MKVLRRTSALQAQLKLFRSGGRTIGFVPTMGALHAGHIELVRRARASCDRVVVSIFVNPLQFGPNEDLARYPRRLAADVDMCRKAGADIVFAPEPSAFLRMKSLVKVPAAPLKKYLCGPFRPGHFDGVATIVAHFFRLVRPDKAFFGLKDYQQFRVIQEMSRKHFAPSLELIGVPTVREKNGLAMSSRNRYLKPRRRAEAAALYKALTRARASVRKNGANAANIRAELIRELG